MSTEHAMLQSKPDNEHSADAVSVQDPSLALRVGIVEPSSALQASVAEPAAALQAKTEPVRKPRWPMLWLLPGLVSSLLLWAAFFPLSWGALAWVALVPLLTLARLPVARWKIFLGGWMAGCVFFLAALQWMRVADERMVYTWLMLAVYCALYFPLGVFLIRMFDRGTPMPLMLSVPIVWTGLEVVRSVVMTGFAWYFLGYSQHAYLPVIQIADLAGVYGVTFVVAAVNGWLLECLWYFAPVRRFLGGPVDDAPGTFVRSGKATLACQGLGLAATLAGVLIYGYIQLAHDQFDTGPRVALLQGNLDQRIRNDADVNAAIANNVLLSYADLSDRAYRLPAKGPDLIVWPESAFPFSLPILPSNPSQRTPQENEEFLYVDFKMQSLPVFPLRKKEKELDRALTPAEVQDLARALTPEEVQEIQKRLKVSHLLGLSTRVKVDVGRYKNYNSALLIPYTSDARQDRYDKIHRVPFGEYVPLREWLPFMNELAPYDHDYSIHIGEKQTRFVLGQYRFGVLICNEDADPVLGRAYGAASKDGPAVDFIVNISNDGWFADTSEHEEHLAICRFRAVECRRAVCRAVNMGISAIIDSNGRVQKPEQLPIFHQENCEFWQVEAKDGVTPELPVSEWAQYKNVQGVLRGAMPIDHRSSLYVRLGDWLPWGCCIVMAAGFVWSRRKTG